jgi:hypothetical protein
VAEICWHRVLEERSGGIREIEWEVNERFFSRIGGRWFSEWKSKGIRSSDFILGIRSGFFTIVSGVTSAFCSEETAKRLKLIKLYKLLPSPLKGGVSLSIIELIEASRM